MSDRDRTQSTTDDGDVPVPPTAETDTEDGSDGSARRTASNAHEDGSDVRDLILRGALVILGLVAVVALVQFYTSAVAVIDEWVGREYRALFRAAFNLVVLLAAGIGISAVVRELTGDDGDAP